MTTDLIDSYGRTIKDLRISVTDRCNFRCTYCMPEEGMNWLPRSEVMTFEEIERLARIFVGHYGVTGIRLTGGEPTVRAHLPVLVQKLAGISGEAGPIDLSMTTNGATMRLIAEVVQGALEVLPAPSEGADEARGVRGGEDAPGALKSAHLRKARRARAVAAAAAAGRLAGRISWLSVL